jgi:hypothetical protein
MMCYTKPLESHAERVRPQFLSLRQDHGLKHALLQFSRSSLPASSNRQARRRIGEQAYVQWLGFLDCSGDLDPSASPGDPATGARLAAFVAGLRDRAPVSAGMMIGALLRMLTVLEPEQDPAGASS